jgi:GR25 family glycosyltransferase involved in LPS biosynthesis
MSLTSKIDMVYVIHYTPLVERKEYLLNFFNSNNITNYEFRSIYQREYLTEELYKKSFKLHYTENMKPAVVCITLEHIEIYKDIIQNDFDNWCLVLEDDSVFNNDFIEKINFFMEYVPTDAEYLDINDFMFDYNNFDYTSEVDVSKLWEPKKGTRTTGSYLIKKNTCSKLIKTIIPFEYPIDHELNKQIGIHNINTYHSIFPLVLHGTGRHNMYKNSY